MIGPAASTKTLIAFKFSNLRVPRPRYGRCLPSLRATLENTRSRPGRCRQNGRESYTIAYPEAR